jgi:hypothetical protein
VRAYSAALRLSISVSAAFAALRHAGATRAFALRTLGALRGASALPLARHRLDVLPAALSLPHVFAFRVRGRVTLARQAATAFGAMDAYKHASVMRGGCALLRSACQHIAAAARAQRRQRNINIASKRLVR